MQFALLFILAFLIGLAIYWFARNWVIAVSVPMVLFLLSTLADHAARDAWAPTLIFGLPIVFFASLLGAYVLQMRVGEPDELELNETEREREQDNETAGS